MEIARTQEFTFQWSAEPGGPFSEIVRQQWSFSPQGSTSEIEDYQVNLDTVSILELYIMPDLTPNNAFATLAKVAHDIRRPEYERMTPLHSPIKFGRNS
jgi:hypothetical protein